MFKRIPYSILAIPGKIILASFFRQCFTCTKKNIVYTPLSIKGIYLLLVQHNYQHHFTTSITKNVWVTVWLLESINKCSISTMPSNSVKAKHHHNGWKASLSRRGKWTETELTEPLWAILELTCSKTYNWYESNCDNSF